MTRYRNSNGISMLQDLHISISTSVASFMSIYLSLFVISQSSSNKAWRILGAGSERASQCRALDPRKRAVVSHKVFHECEAVASQKRGEGLLYRGLVCPAR